MVEETESNRENLEICPNCLEPNAKDLANCAYCGMPLRPQTSETGEIIESPENRASGEETPEHETEQKKSAPPQQAEKKKSNWTRVMRGMGLYLIVYAIMELPRSFQLENPNDRTLSIISNVIYIVAGGMLAWPMLKEYLAKRKAKQQGEGGNTIIEGEITSEDNDKDDNTIIEGEIISEDDDKVETTSDSSNVVNLNDSVNDSVNEEVERDEISEASNDSAEDKSPAVSSDSEENLEG